MAGVRHIEVTAEEAGQKLLQFLQRRLGKDVPKSAVMRWIRTGQVRINKGRAKPFDRLEAGDVVRVPPHDSSRQTQSESAQRTAQPVGTDDVPTSLPHLPGISCVGQADGLLVLNKPAGLPVQPGTGHTDAVTTRLANSFAHAPFMPTPAHRLDKDTSGLLLVATSYQRLQALHALFREAHDLQKVYLAWTAGSWPYDGPEVLTDTLAKRNTGKGERMVRVAANTRPDTSDDDAKDACSTAYPVLHSNTATLLAVSIHTGRTHQIRVQLAGRGHPIIGDVKYGGPNHPQGMMLHAWLIRLPDGNVFSCLPDWTAPYYVHAEHLHATLVMLEAAFRSRNS